jgi:myo-inositol-hexaphosphate 3-phosphohydrolase
MRESVTRYVGTYVNKDGERTLMTAAQGRNTYATEAEAQAWVDAVAANNSADNIRQTFGDNPQFEVRPVPCYPNHFDPQTVWFD